MRKYLVALLLSLMMLPLSAETVSQKQAMQMAQLFFNQASGKVTAPPKLVYNGRRLTTNRLFVPFYVYNNSLGGFVIISADNKAYPILGYSLKESFDPDALGETEKALLQSYALEVEFVRYDGNPVDKVADAWINYDEFLAGVLGAQYIATDPKISIEESEEMVYQAIEKDDAVFSDIYTPEQWLEMIGEELAKTESVPLAIIGNGLIYPAVVYGRQGDYFRLEMTKRNQWLMRLNATDVISSNMASVVNAPIRVENFMAEEAPFADHDAFLEEVGQTEAYRTSKAGIDVPMLEDEPLVKASGGGKFEVLLPEGAVASTVYNISGAAITRKKYNQEYVIPVDLSAEPYGFYIVTVLGESGQSYGIKLYR